MPPKRPSESNSDPTAKRKVSSIQHDDYNYQSLSSQSQLFNTPGIPNVLSRGSPWPFSLSASQLTMASPTKSSSQSGLTNSLNDDVPIPCGPGSPRLPASLARLQRHAANFNSAAKSGLGSANNTVTTVTVTNTYASLFSGSGTVSGLQAGVTAGSSSMGSTSTSAQGASTSSTMATGTSTTSIDMLAKQLSDVAIEAADGPDTGC